jgi:ribosome-binding protein aMBF1 (putative translation factor)
MKAIYIIAEDGGDRCKVGVAGDVRKRVQALQTSHSRRLLVAGAWRVAEAHKLEAAVHTRLAAQRIVGEWFAVTPAEAGCVVGRVSAEIGLELAPVNLRLEVRETQRFPRLSRRPQSMGEAPLIKTSCTPLQAWREQSGLSQRELASKLFIKHTTVSRMERGESRPSRTVTLRLMALTGLSADQLLLHPAAEEAA